MSLKLASINLEDIQFGEKTKIEGKTLVVNKEKLQALLKEDKRIESVGLEITRPGDKTRIIPVKDVIEPRYKVDSDVLFPGSLDDMQKVGEGTTKVLKNTAVVTTGSIVGIQEGIIDMWGEGAKYTPFSKTYNLVVDLKVTANIDEHDHEEAVRLAGLRAASFLGKAAADVKADEIKEYDLESISENNDKNLPKVSYVKMLIAQGLLHDTYIYGVDSKEILPTLLHPNEILDGAMVSGNCVAACDKITTYQHQNNSIILDLYEHHGKDLLFQGVVLSPELTTLAGKNRNCSYTAGLVKQLGSDGVIISEEGYGNPDSDLLHICKLLEDEDIKTTLITDECAGRDGFSQSLADSRPEAKAVVSTGNVSHPVTLPPADRVIGKKEVIAHLAGGTDDSIKDDGRMVCELNAIIGSTSEIGYHNVTARLY
ncbi:MAG: glycine/sarcosine/betaine reductase component B subunit [Bacillota bacterium]